MRYRSEQMLQLILLSLGILNYRASVLVKALNCRNVSEHANKLQFSLVRHCQRSKQNVITLENTQNLEECFTLAKRMKGLALNYAPVSRRNTENLFATNVNDDNDSVFYRNTAQQQRRRQHFWQQPEEFFNCHILACPENATFRTMINDSRFDYFSLYGRALVSQNYSCIPQVGIFQLHANALNYKNAAESCATNFTGDLAHVISANRTNSLAKLLVQHNENRRSSQYDRVSRGRSINLAYVGLHYNRSWVQFPTDFLTTTNESLKCFLYRAWAPGHPRRNGVLANSSCVAISTSHAWVTVDCERQLPFICELYTSKPVDDDDEGMEYLDFVDKNVFPEKCIVN